MELEVPFSKVCVGGFGGEVCLLIPDVVAVDMSVDNARWMIAELTRFADEAARWEAR